MTRRRRAKQQETTVDINAIPLPVRRGVNEVAAVRRINKIGENVALATVKQVFSTRLTSHIRSFVTSESQRKEPLTESKFNEKMDELKANLLERKKVPRGIFEEADNIGKYAMRTISKSLGRNHSSPNGTSLLSKTSQVRTVTNGKNIWRLLPKKITEDSSNTGCRANSYVYDNDKKYHKAWLASRIYRFVDPATRENSHGCDQLKKRFGCNHSRTDVRSVCQRLCG